MPVELMATVVNRSQQVVTSGFSPESAYSRVVAIHAHVAAGIDAEARQYTETFGQRLRLLRTDIWLYVGDLANVADGWFSIMTGLEEPGLAPAMIRQWDMVIPNQRGDVNAFVWIGNREHFGWDMKRLYTTVPRRFGVVLHNYSDEVPFDAIVTFTVSEG